MHKKEVGVIDLADTLSPVPYSKLAEREYRKLQKLHTSVQEDKNVRISKKMPQYSYTNRSTPDLPFLKESQTEDNQFYSIDDDPFFALDDDLPMPSAFEGSNQITHGPVNVSLDSYSGGKATSSITDDSIESLEAAMLDLNDPMVTVTSPKHRANASFENKVFDFEAFDEGAPREGMNYELFSSPLMRDARTRSQSPHQTSQKNQNVSLSPQSLKRIGSFSPERLSAKHRRVNMEERFDKEEAITDEPGDKKSVNQDEADRQSRPAWVDEMDPEIIQSLIGIVDFIE